jgi:hypothetical protein
MMGRIRTFFVVSSIAILLAGGTGGGAFASEKPKKEREKEKKSERAAQPSPASLEALEETIADLKAQLADLKAQVQKQELKSEAQANVTSVTEKPIASPNPPATTAVAAIPSAGTTPAAPAAAPAAPQNLTPPSNPLQLKIGDAFITPIGFMDLTNTFRSTNAGTSLQTNFGSIPYNNTTAGRLTEDKFSAANSRIGFRVDATVKGANILGYYEGDFVGGFGNGGFNTQVSSNSLLYRIRLYWINVQKGKFEVLGGQSWSMMTPNRKQISAVPGDLFYSQVVDVNYMNGLTWGRIPGVRFLYHPSSRVTMGVSLENAAQYFGGSGGGGTPTLPAALATPIAGELDQNVANGIGIPNVHPDIIGKIAFDLNPRVHFEVAGVESTVKLFNPLTQVSFTKGGGGGAINGNFEVVKGLRLVTNNFWSDGAGRYLFGVAPDFIVRADGSPSMIHSGSTLDGFELAHKNTQLYVYYGGIYIKPNTALDANGTTRIGYGFPGSLNSHNRTTQEGTIGFTQTVWRDAKYGALQMMFQYAYLFRNPWSVLTGAPKNTHENVGWFNLRYVLPGAPPSADDLKR